MKRATQVFPVLEDPLLPALELVGDVVLGKYSTRCKQQGD
jgi:hypothetical protein